MNYFTCVCLCLCVIADADEQDVGRMLTHFSHVVAGTDLGDGVVGSGILFQLDDYSRGADVAAWDQHKVSEALARCQLTVYHIFIAGFIENTYFYKPNFIKSQDLFIVPSWHNEFS